MSIDTERMTTLWAEVLDRPVKPHDDLFVDIGGSSLQVVQLIVAIEDEWGIEIGIRAFFDNPTPAAVAELAASVPAGSDID